MKFGSKFGKKDEVVVNSDNATPQVELKMEEQDLNSMAFSLTTHPEGGFALEMVKYNPVTMQAKVDEVRTVGTSRSEAEDQFKMAVGRYMADLEMKS